MTGSTLRTWFLTVVGGAAATVLTNAYFHLLPLPAEPHPLVGTIVASQGDTVVIVPLANNRQPVEIKLQSRLLTASTETKAWHADILATQVRHPSWDTTRNLFWTTSTQYIGESLLDSVIGTLNGRGEAVRQYYISHTEDLDFPVPAPVTNTLIYQAHQVNQPAHLAIVNLGTGEAHRIASYAAGPFSLTSNDKHLAYACHIPQGASSTLCIVDVKTRKVTPFTVPGFSGILMPAFSPNGNYIAAAATTGPGITNALIVLDAHSRRLVWAARDVQTVASPTWSPDGRYIAYTGPLGVMVRDIQSERSQLLLKGEFESVQWVTTDAHGFGLP